jgi:hypothetical protein
MGEAGKERESRKGGKVWKGGKMKMRENLLY